VRFNRTIIATIIMAIIRNQTNTLLNLGLLGFVVSFFARPANPVPIYPPDNVNPAWTIMAVLPDRFVVA